MRTALIHLVAAVVLVLTIAYLRWKTDVEFNVNGVPSTYEVTTSLDGGPGSLREALFLASTLPTSMRINIRVPSIRLAEPLPPILNPHGVTIKADSAGVEIDASHITEHPAIHVQSPRSSIEAVCVRGAPTGIVIDAPYVSLQNAELVDCDLGVLVGSRGTGVRIVGTRVGNNGRGLEVDPAAGDIQIIDCDLSHNTIAGIRCVASVAPTTRGQAIRIIENRFESNYIAIVTGNVSAWIGNNSFRTSVESSIYVAGDGAVEIRGNLVSHGERYGIFSESGSGLTVEGNEIHDCGIAGIQLNGGAGNVIRSNRLHRNAHGVIVIGGSTKAPHRIIDNVLLAQAIDGITIVGSEPIVSGNHIAGSGRAALHLLDLATRDEDVVHASPRLERNTLVANAEDVVREAASASRATELASP